MWSDHYFTKLDSSINWIRNPFAASDETMEHLSPLCQEKLLELKSDKTLEMSYSGNNICKFWISVSEEYKELFQQSLKILVQFRSTYLCESGFSALTTIKTKYRNRLNIEDDMRLALSNIVPNIERTCVWKTTTAVALNCISDHMLTSRLCLYIYLWCKSK